MGANLFVVTGPIGLPGNNRGSDSPATSTDPVAQSRELAAAIAARLGTPSRARLSAPVRQNFVVQAAADGPAPPLARLLHGGRGGEVKIKTLLSIIWIAVREPYDVRASAQVWARLIGLADPGGRGAARVNSALRQLVKNEYLRREATVGEASRFFLLEESGTGRPYTPPGRRVVELRSKEADFSEHRYLQVPTQLWTNGWLAELHGPGLAMLLALLAQASGRDHRDIWFSPGVADERFHLSEETRKRGLDQLAELRLVTIRRRPIARQPWDSTRLRNTYTLNLDHMREAQARGLDVVGR